jgi:hypothetical protein
MDGPGWMKAGMALIWRHIAIGLVLGIAALAKSRFGGRGR